MKIARRIIFACVYLIGIYIFYLVVLGPVEFLGHRGYLTWVSPKVRHAIVLSVKPVEVIPYTADVYHRYIKFWTGSSEVGF